MQAGLGSKAADVRNRLQALVDASEPEPEPRPGLGEDAATPRPQAVKLAVDVLKHAARIHDLVARGDVGRRGEALRLFCEGAALLTEAAAAPGMSEPLRAALEEKLSDVNSIIERYGAFAIKRFWTPFSRPFPDRFGPFFGVLVPVSGILAARWRERRKNEKKRSKNGREMA